MDDRTEIASRALAGYLASPNYKFEDLSTYAMKARIVADMLIIELQQNPKLTVAEEKEIDIDDEEARA